MLRCKRLISDVDEPLAIVISYLNTDIFQDLKIDDISQSLYESLYNKYTLIPTQATASYSYSIAGISPKTAKLLNQPKSTIVIYSERLAYLPDGVSCEFAESYIRQDKFKIQIDYKTNSGNTVQWSIK